MNDSHLAIDIVHAACRVRQTLGPGLLESGYESALASELDQKGIPYTRQQAVPVIYNNIAVLAAFHADLIVANLVIVEIKAVELLAPVHKKQLLTYLKLADNKVRPPDQLQRSPHQRRHNPPRQRPLKPTLSHAFLGVLRPLGVCARNSASKT